MANIENKANELIAEVEKKSAFNFFQSLFNKRAQTDHAIECYQRAGNLFKVSKNFQKAAGCFTKAGDLSRDSDSRYDAAMNFVNAANCFKKCEPEMAITSLLKAIEIFTDMGKFNIAAKHHKSIAEIYENNLLDPNLAIQHYEQASEFFRSEEIHSSSEACLLKVAHHAAVLEDYRKATDIYHEVALGQVGNSLLKYSVQSNLFKATLCHLCSDILSGQTVLEHFVGLFPLFQDSAEYKFLKLVVEALESDSLDKFSAAVYNFNNTFRTDDWTRTLLLRIERNLTGGVDLR